MEDYILAIIVAGVPGILALILAIASYFIKRKTDTKKNDAVAAKDEAEATETLVNTSIKLMKKLQQEVSDLSERVDELSDDIVNKDKEIARLRKVVEKRDGRITELEKIVESQAERITTLEGLMKNK